MSELDPEARALIDAARDGLEATSEDRARIRRSVLAAVTTSAIGAGTVASAASAQSAIAVTSGTTLATKMLLGIALVATVATGGVIAESAFHRAEPPSPRAAREVAAPRVTEPPEVVAPRAIVREVAPPAPQTTPVELASAPIAAPRPPRERRAPPPPVIVEPEPPRAHLALEVAALRASDAARRGGRPADALRALDAYDRDFPSGTLRAEADAARVLTLCELGRADDARAVATRFLAQNPSSPLAARIRSSCASIP